MTVRLRWLTVGTIAVTALSLLGAIAAYIFAISVNQPFPITSAFAFAAMLLNTGAVPLFLIGLPGFKADLKRAYGLICAGIILFGIAQAQLPILTWFDLWIWADTGGMAVPYLLAVVLIFIGVRRFAALLEIKNRVTSLLWASGVAAGLSLLVSLLPHVQTKVSELPFRLSVALSIWDTVFIAFAAAGVWLIRKRVSHMYVRAMTWLFAAFAMIAFGGLHYAAVTMLFAEGNWYFDYSAVMVPFVAGAFLLVGAGYVFNMIGHEKRVEVVSFDRQLIDTVVYTASLASDPQKVDVILDDLRVITSAHKSGVALSHKDVIGLVAVFRRLEKYLTTTEPLRVFTRDSLRDDLEHHFILDSTIIKTLYPGA